MHTHRYKQVGIDEFADGLNRSIQNCHTMKADGRIPQEARREAGHRGACRWYAVTVEAYFEKLHALLNKSRTPDFNECARMATKHAEAFDRKHRKSFKQDAGRAPGREIANNERRSTSSMVA